MNGENLSFTSYAFKAQQVGIEEEDSIFLMLAKLLTNEGIHNHVHQLVWDMEGVGGGRPGEHQRPGPVHIEHCLAGLHSPLRNKAGEFGVHPGGYLERLEIDFMR